MSRWPAGRSWSTASTTTTPAPRCARRSRPRTGSSTPLRPPAGAFDQDFRTQAMLDEQTRNKILKLLDEHRNMTIATLRPDGWPQATTVGYANDGLTLYFLCGL